MVAVRVDVHIKLLVGLYQGFAVFAGIAEVNIVIGSTMHQEQLTVELVYPVHGRRSFVTFHVFLRSTHETFGIDGIVETPVGRSGYGYTCLEYRRTFAHRHQCGVSTEAPSPDADVLGIHIRECAEVKGCFHLVAGFLHTEVHVSTFLEFSTTSTGTTSVYTDGDKAVIGHVCFEHTAIATGTDVPLVDDSL